VPREAHLQEKRTIRRAANLCESRPIFDEFRSTRPAKVPKYRAAMRGRAPRQKNPQRAPGALGFGVALKRYAAAAELPSIAASLNSSVKLRFGDGRTFFTSN
jgi:hypothetical protein